MTQGGEWGQQGLRMSLTLKALGMVKRGGAADPGGLMSGGLRSFTYAPCSSAFKSA